MDPSKMAVGFVGLGVMGYPMAGHLANAGLDIVVYNRTASVAQKFAQEHGAQNARIAATPAEVGQAADVVFMCVGNDNDVRSVACGENGVFAGLSAGNLLIDHTTTSAELAKELGGLAAAIGCDFLDAPVSGGQAGAEQGILTVMIGGSQATYDRAQPLLRHFARTHRLMGDIGAGQMTKMVNQICIAGVIQGLAEGLNFAGNVGLDPLAVVEVISKGAAQSWQMENRYETMAAGNFDFGFAVDWMRKDLGIALATARDNGVTLPLTALVDQFYADVQNAGGGRFDTSSLITRLQKQPASSGSAS